MDGCNGGYLNMDGWDSDEADGNKHTSGKPSGADAAKSMLHCAIDAKLQLLVASDILNPRLTFRRHLRA